MCREWLKMRAFIIRLDFQAYALRVLSLADALEWYVDLMIQLRGTYVMHMASRWEHVDWHLVAINNLVLC